MPRHMESCNWNNNLKKYTVQDTLLNRNGGGVNSIQLFETSWFKRFEALEDSFRFASVGETICAVIVSPLLSPMMVAGAEGPAGSNSSPPCFRFKQPAIKLETADWGPGRSCYWKPKTALKFQHKKTVRVRYWWGTGYICPLFAWRYETKMNVTRRITVSGAPCLVAATNNLVNWWIFDIQRDYARAASCARATLS